MRLESKRLAWGGQPLFGIAIFHLFHFTPLTKSLYFILNPKTQQKKT